MPRIPRVSRLLLDVETRKAERGERFSPCDPGQLLEPTDGRQLVAAVARRDGDADDRSSRSWDHGIAHVCARLDAPRGLEHGWNANRQHHHGLGSGPLARSTPGGEPTRAMGGTLNPVRRIAAGDRSDRRRALIFLASRTVARTASRFAGASPAHNACGGSEFLLFRRLHPPTEEPAMTPHAPPTRLTVDQGPGRRFSLGARRPDRAPPPGSRARRTSPPPRRPPIRFNFLAAPCIPTKREKMTFQILQRPPDPGEAAGSRAGLGAGLLRVADGSASKPACRDRPRGLAGLFPSGRPSSGVSRAPARILRAPHEPAAPPASNPFQFSRSPLNAHKTGKNGFPNRSTAAGPGRRGGIAGR